MKKVNSRSLQKCKGLGSSTIPSSKKKKKRRSNSKRPKDKED